VTRTYRLLLGVVVLGAAGFGYWNFLLSPKRKDAADLATKVSVAQAQVAQTQQTLKEYLTAKSKYAANYSEIVRLGKAAPSDDDTRSLVVQVDAAAKRSGIAFANIDLVAGAATASATSSVATAPTPGASKLPPGAVNGGSYSLMPFQFSFEGEYDRLSNFFSRLERFVTLRGDKIEVNGRLLRIDKIALTPVDDGWPKIQAQIDAYAYVVPKDGDPAAGATASGPAGAAGSTASTGSSASTGATTTSSSPTTTSDLR
jgi:Tfp pilus assembly protein PilO